MAHALGPEKRICELKAAWLLRALAHDYVPYEVTAQAMTPQFHLKQLRESDCARDKLRVFLDSLDVRKPRYARLYHTGQALITMAHAPVAKREEAFLAREPLDDDDELVMALIRETRREELLLEAALNRLIRARDEGEEL